MNAAAADLPFMLSLFSRELGAGLYTMDGLRRDLADPEVGMVVEPGAGAALSRLLVPEDAAYYDPFGDFSRGAFAAGTVGSLEALAVEPPARRRGVGASLVQASERWLGDAGALSVAVIAWVSGRPDSSLPLLRRLGYAESAPVDRFYFDDSARLGWSCPVDGCPCRCSAVLFAKFLPAGTGSSQGRHA